MEKISNHSYGNRSSFHARLSWPVGAKRDSKAAHPGAGAFTRSNDGDTFTLSFEARSLRNSRAIAGETASAPETLAPIAPGSMAAREGKHRHHFPSLSNPQDVADRLLERLDQEFAEKGGSGSRDAFAEEAKRRLTDWKAAAGARISEEYRDFRLQVHLKLAGGLEAWARQGDSVME